MGAARHRMDGLTMTFASIDRPLEYYTLALERAGFAIAHGLAAA
jgi:hypothetical protein